MALRPPAPNLPTPSSLTSSSSLSSPDQGAPPPLSSPWACQIEWFNNDDNSLSFTPTSPTDIASSSLYSICPSTASTPMIESPPSPPLHVFLDYDAWTRLLSPWENLQSLIFDACRDMDDLCFRMELMDKRGERLELLLTTLLNSLHTHGTTTNALAATMNAPTTSAQAIILRAEEDQTRHEH